MRRFVFLLGLLLFIPALGQGDLPNDNPAAKYKIVWVDSLAWKNVVNITDAAGGTLEKKLASAHVTLAKQGGGVVFFPKGVYTWNDHIKIPNGVIWRGETPKESSAHSEKYTLETKFEFPKYTPKFEGEGTPIETAFKGIYLANPETDSNCGLVNIAINRGHIDFGEAEGFKSGKNRLVYGCILRNAAIADPKIPDLKIGQHAWQRYTARHAPAVKIHASENILVANNRLPKSGDDDFVQKDYILTGKGKDKSVTTDVAFDYDNRPGLYINEYGLGASGGQYPEGTPETHPQGFRKGVVIRDNYIFSTGRCAIAFTGDGTYCGYNVIRFAKDIRRPTTTGTSQTFGSSTNDNRAVQMRGFRWIVEGNDYEVHRNLAFDGKYYFNDGEGLMHEDHANSTVKDSKLLKNKGNTYISIYHTGGIDGLLIEGNDIRTPGGIEAIYVVANKQRDTKKHECKNVQIISNTTSGTGIRITGEPTANNLIKNNKHIGENGTIANNADAKEDGNENYTKAKK